MLFKCGDQRQPGRVVHIRMPGAGLGNQLGENTADQSGPLN